MSRDRAWVFTTAIFHSIPHPASFNFQGLENEKSQISGQIRHVGLKTHTSQLSLGIATFTLTANSPFSTIFRYFEAHTACSFNWTHAQFYITSVRLRRTLFSSTQQDGWYSTGVFYNLAGVGGFEPPNAGSKDLCLTA